MADLGGRELPLQHLCKQKLEEATKRQLRGGDPTRDAVISSSALAEREAWASSHLGANLTRLKILINIIFIKYKTLIHQLIA